MAVECKWYHSRHAELVATKKGENCVMNSGKSILCAPEIGIAGLKRLPRFYKSEIRTIGHWQYFKRTRQYWLRHWEHCVIYIFYFCFCFVLFCFFFNHKKEYYCSPSGSGMFLLYSPQSSSVIKSKMAATTIRTWTSFRPPKIRLLCSSWTFFLFKKQNWCLKIALLCLKIIFNRNKCKSV